MRALLPLSLSFFFFFCSALFLNRYRYAPWRKADVATAEEASEWEKAKSRVSGLHFLAIQDDPEAEDCKGFWVLRDPPVPRL